MNYDLMNIKYVNSSEQNSNHVGGGGVLNLQRAPFWLYVTHIIDVPGS
jgi:hypothetical protein